MIFFGIKTSKIMRPKDAEKNQSNERKTQPRATHLHTILLAYKVFKEIPNISY